MFEIIRETRGNTQILRLKGSINETTPFAKTMGTLSGDVEIHCKDVATINSSGVKAWIQYFQSTAASGARFRLTDCSPAIVDQLNMIVNFNCGAEVLSIYVPFACDVCNHSMLALFKCDDLIAAKLEITAPACLKCGEATTFDEIAEEYLGFLTRPSYKAVLAKRGG